MGSDRVFWDTAGARFRGADRRIGTGTSPRPTKSLQSTASARTVAGRQAVKPSDVDSVANPRCGLPRVDLSCDCPATGQVSCNSARTRG